MSALPAVRQLLKQQRAISFETFMETALYAPDCGYYTRQRDPFGKQGDFYTAEQVQPVFGILVANWLRRLLATLHSRTVVEVGAGRGEMSERLSLEFDYTAVDRMDQMPRDIRGVVFTNELFDALPVHLVKKTRNGWREVYISAARDGSLRFARTMREPSTEVLHYLEQYHAGARTGSMVEVNLRARRMVELWTHCVRQGYAIIIDYGYTAREWGPRYSHGTLMSYHRHAATDDVLLEPGDRDITAHVAWTPLEDCFRAHGWHVESFERMAHVLMLAGEHDQFASLFEGCDEKEQARRRLQLKTLLFGMGEVFRVLTVSKGIEAGTK